jgi:hypothetical protein
MKKEWIWFGYYSPVLFGRVEWNDLAQENTAKCWKTEWVEGGEMLDVYRRREKACRFVCANLNVREVA